VCQDVQFYQKASNMSNETRGLRLLYPCFRSLHHPFMPSRWMPEKSGGAIDRGWVLLLYL